MLIPVPRSARPVPRRYIKRRAEISQMNQEHPVHSAGDIVDAPGHNAEPTEHLDGNGLHQQQSQVEGLH